MRAHEQRIGLLAGAVAAVPTVAALALLWTRAGVSPGTRWLATAVLLAVVVAGIHALELRVARPLQTLANILTAIREGDFSIRAPQGARGDALGLAMHELNALASELRERRLAVLEATAMLRRVMEEIDVAVMAFDADGRLRLVNAEGERVAGAPAARIIGLPASELGLGECLEGPAPRTLELTLAGRATRWALRRGEFRQEGRPHTFVVLADVSRALREEEQLAWQRLVRVLGHEINNSLTPIRSTAERLADSVGRNGAATDDVQRGLALIARRAQRLSGFLASYTAFTTLPQPVPGRVSVGEWLDQVARLDARVPVVVCPGPPITVTGDGAQLDQMLINLVRNAADAVLDGGGAGEVRLGWSADARSVTVRVDDDGPGLPPSANLFVPFFTTKREGSGIGLVLARQIADAHGGSLTIANRPEGGCRVEVELPRG